MSYPWWKFKITFTDGNVREYIGTGFDAGDAISDLLSWKEEDFGVDNCPRKYPYDILNIQCLGAAEGYEQFIPEWPNKIVILRQAPGTTNTWAKSKQAIEERETRG